MKDTLRINLAAEQLLTGVFAREARDLWSSDDEIRCFLDSTHGSPLTDEELIEVLTLAITLAQRDHEARDSTDPQVQLHYVRVLNRLMLFGSTTLRMLYEKMQRAQAITQ